MSGSFGKSMSGFAKTLLRTLFTVRIALSLLFLNSIVVLTLVLTGHLPANESPDDWRNSPWLIGIGMLFVGYLMLAEWFPYSIGFRVRLSEEELREMKAERCREIRKWLHTKLTVEGQGDLLSVSCPERPQIVEQHSAWLQRWYRDQGRDSDELWWYTKDGLVDSRSYEQMGFAILRDEGVVDFRPLFD